MKIKQFSPFPTATTASTIVALIALIPPGNERAILLRGERVGETFTDGGRRIQARAWPTHHIPKIGAVRREKEIRKYPSRIIFE